MKHQDLTDWTGIPAATAKATFSALQIQQSPDLSRGFVIKYDPIGDLTGLASKPAPWVRNSQTPKTTKGRDKNDLSMFGTGRRTDWTGTPAVTAKATFFFFFFALQIQQSPDVSRGFVILNMVPVGGLEPPRPKATDFESVVYTNFTIPALSWGIALSMFGIIRMRTDVASIKT